MTEYIIDSHSHLHGKEFVDDFAEVVDRARGAKVSRIALVGVDPEDTERALAVAENYPDLFFVVAGLHPHESAKWSEETRQRILQQAMDNRELIKGIGEMGLDYHYDFAPRDKQREAFVGQMEIARDLDLPIVIHCREAYEECQAMLGDFYGARGSGEFVKEVRGVLHCFFGTVDDAREAVDLGFMLGIGGSSTFKRAEGVHEVVREIPLEHLVLETDAPYMAPVPFRGKRNESAYLDRVVARVAELKGIERGTVMRVTSDNSRRLFRL